EELPRERDRCVEQIVRGPVVRHLFEANPRPLSVRRDCTEGVHVRRESSAEGGEGRVSIERVADGEIQRDGRYEGHEVPSLRGLFLHLHGDGGDAVEVRDQVRREDAVVPHEEGVDQRLANQLGERGNLDRLFDVVPVAEEPHLSPPAYGRTPARTDRGSASPDGESRLPPGRSPSRAAGSTGVRAMDISS